MTLTAAEVEHFHREGYVLLPGYIPPDMLAAAQAEIPANHPLPAEYFADPDAWPRYGKSQFSLVKFPFGSWDLNRVGLSDVMVSAAGQCLGTDDIRLTKGEFWAKYTGAIDYDQGLHRDFGNHTLVVPRADHRYKEVTTFVFLSDVEAEDGPTALVPRRHTDHISLGIHRLPQDEACEDHELLATGPAGTVLLYSYDVFHRATNLTRPGGARFMLLFDYRRADAPWIARQGWPEYGMHPRMMEVVTRASPGARTLFDIPPPGHDYWNAQTIADMATRYDGFDTAPYMAALSPRS